MFILFIFKWIQSNISVYQIPLPIGKLRMKVMFGLRVQFRAVNLLEFIDSLPSMNRVGSSYEGVTLKQKF